MKFEISFDITAPRDRVWEWWTDFGKPGESFRVWHGNGWGTRTIQANDGKRVELSDRTPLAGDVARVVEIGERYHFKDTGVSPKRPFRSEWLFEEPRAGVTRVVRRIEFPTPAIAKVLGPLGRALAKRLILKDLKAHCEECQRELAR